MTTAAAPRRAHPAAVLDSSGSAAADVSALDLMAEPAPEPVRRGRRAAGVEPVDPEPPADEPRPRRMHVMSGPDGAPWPRSPRRGRDDVPSPGTVVDPPASEAEATVSTPTPPVVTPAAPTPAAPVPPAPAAAEPSIRPAPDRPRPATIRAEPIRCRGLTKCFGPVTAVDRLDLTIRPGRITGLVGLPGSGKTTVLRMLLGLVRPTTGSATFGRSPYARLRHPQRTVGSVLEARFHPRRTPRNHLRVLAVTAGESNRRVDEMLSLVGLTSAARRRVTTFSTAMRQRLALAGALLGDPAYLVLDEPTTGVHPGDRRWLVDFLRSFADTGRTVLLASARLDEVADLVDDVVVLHHGRLVRHTSLAELELATRAVVVRTSSPERAREVVAELGLAYEVGHDDDGPYLRVRGELPETIGAALYLRNVSVFELRRERFELAGLLATDQTQVDRAA